MELEDFRVWPDGTVQAVSDGSAPTWMSDDYMTVAAADHDDALFKASQVGGV